MVLVLVMVLVDAMLWEKVSNMNLIGVLTKSQKESSVYFCIHLLCLWWALHGYISHMQGMMRDGHRRFHNFKKNGINNNINKLLWHLLLSQ